MSATTNDTQRKSLFRIPSLFEIFFGRLAKWIRQLATWRKQGLLKRALQERHRRTMRMEVLEPRLLLSADLTAGATWGTTLTVTATDATHVQMTDGTVPNTVTAALTGDGVIKISRDTTGDITSDTVQLDLASLDGLNLGGATILDLKFTGGRQTFFQDQVQLQGTGVFGHDVKVESDAAIKVNAGASLTATGHDITLSVSETDTGFGLSGHNPFADATHSTVTVLGNLSASNILLTADSTIDIKTDSLSFSDVAKLAFILADSTADVDITGSSQITATSTLALHATSTIKAVADMTSDSGHSGDNTDAAVASVIITSDTHARISGDAVINTTGASLSLLAKTTNTAIAIGDGTSGGKGATVGVTVITGATEASVKGNAQIVGANSITISADRSNDAIAVAKSTTGGSTDSGGGQESNKQLSDNKAGDSSGGSISFAGAVAVGTVVSHTTAYVDTTGSVTSSGKLEVSSTSVTSSQTLADGSPTAADASAGSGSGNVGIAVGVGVGDLHNDAFVHDTAVSGITAGALSVKAVMGSLDRTLGFEMPPRRPSASPAERMA